MSQAEKGGARGPLARSAGVARAGSHCTAGHSLTSVRLSANSTGATVLTGVCANWQMRHWSGSCWEQSSGVSSSWWDASCPAAGQHACSSHKLWMCAAGSTSIPPAKTSNPSMAKTRFMAVNDTRRPTPLSTSSWLLDLPDTPLRAHYERLERSPRFVVCPSGHTPPLLVLPDKL